MDSFFDAIDQTQRPLQQTKKRARSTSQKSTSTKKQKLQQSIELTHNERNARKQHVRDQEDAAKRFYDKTQRLEEKKRKVREERKNASDAQQARLALIKKERACVVGIDLSLVSPGIALFDRLNKEWHLLVWHRAKTFEAGTYCWRTPFVSSVIQTRNKRQRCGCGAANGRGRCTCSSTYQFTAMHATILPFNAEGEQSDSEGEDEEERETKEDDMTPRRERIARMLVKTTKIMEWIAATTNAATDAFWIRIGLTPLIGKLCLQYAIVPGQLTRMLAPACFIEDYAVHQKDTRSLTLLAEMGGALRVGLEQNLGQGWTWEEINISTIKKQWTGNGCADKLQMWEAYCSRFICASGVNKIPPPIDVWMRCDMSKRKEHHAKKAKNPKNPPISVQTPLQDAVDAIATAAIHL